MSKILFLIVLCAAFLILSVSDVSACSCVKPKPVEEVYEYTDAIFSGKIISTKLHGKYARRIIVKVEKSWKGKLPKTVTISTIAVGSMCGYSFTVGKRYLIYAGGDKMTDLSTDICTRTSLLSQAKEDVEILDGLPAKNKANTKSAPK